MTSADYMPTNYNLPLPDPGKLIAINDGRRWIRGIIPGTVRIDEADEFITLVCHWSDGSKRRITLSLDQVAGYQEAE